MKSLEQPLVGIFASRSNKRTWNVIMAAVSVATALPSGAMLLFVFRRLANFVVDVVRVASAWKLLRKKKTNNLKSFGTKRRFFQFFRKRKKSNLCSFILFNDKNQKRGQSLGGTRLVPLLALTICRILLLSKNDWNAGLCTMSRVFVLPSNCAIVVSERFFSFLTSRECCFVVIGNAILAEKRDVTVNTSRGAKAQRRCLCDVMSGARSDPFLVFIFDRSRHRHPAVGRATPQRGRASIIYWFALVQASRSLVETRDLLQRSAPDFFVLYFVVAESSSAFFRFVVYFFCCWRACDARLVHTHTHTHLRL